MHFRNLLKVALVLRSVSSAPTHSYTNTTVSAAPFPASEENSPVTDVIKVHGNKFFHSETGEQFFIKGIAYQPSRIAGDEAFANLEGSKFIDPMSSTDICLRDLPYLVKLGINTVRIYSFNPDKDHDDCFKAFADVGIYVIADLSEPDISVVRESPSWDIIIQERYYKVVDSLHKYDNLLGFFAGNEVTNDVTNTAASPFVKSSIRDVKQYINMKGYRSIPVGYSTNDDAATRNNLADYFACGEVSADFYGINMYEWCGYSTFYASGYKERTEEFKDYPVPVFFSEFGCNTRRPRPFTEVEALYGPLMTNVWSGGIAYMYFEEPNQYGVVQLNNGEIEELDDFKYLAEQFRLAKPKGTSLSQFQSKPTIAKVKSCPSNNIVWEASVILPQTPDETKCACMESSLKCRLSNDVKPQNLQALFKYACGEIDCAPIVGDGKSGTYGEFSDCHPKQKASYVINELFEAQGATKEKCDFNGLGSLNPRVALDDELAFLITQDGTSCADVLRTHLTRKVLHSKKIASNTTNETGSSNFTNVGGRSGGKGGYSNKAAQVNFYNSISNTVSASAIFVIALVLVY